MKKFNAQLKLNTEHVNIFNLGDGYIEQLGYTDLNTNNSQLFNPDINLDKDEYFFIELDENKKRELIVPFINSIENSVSINPIDKDQYSQIQCLYLIEKYDNLINITFTRVFPKNYTLTKKVFSFDDTPILKNENNSLDFHPRIDAFWDGEKLFFKSYTTIKPIFKGIECFYKKATEEEKNTFLSNDLFTCNSEIEQIEVGERNLRKIKGILDSQINLNDPSTREKYLNYAENYSEANIIITQEGKINLKDNKDISNVLSLLEEHFYTTPISGEKREAPTSKKL